MDLHTGAGSTRLAPRLSSDNPRLFFARPDLDLRQHPSAAPLTLARPSNAAAAATTSQPDAAAAASTSAPGSTASAAGEGVDAAEPAAAPLRSSLRAFLITVCIHGNEPAGLRAVNQLLEEGYFDAGRHSGQPWPWPWDTLTVLLGNPRAYTANKRFIDRNLNRLFTQPDVHLPPTDPGYTYEHSLVPSLAAAIGAANAYLDVHSTSADTPPFSFHVPDAESAEFARGFPVAYALEDRTASVATTSMDWARSCGLARATTVECGQHTDPETTAVARRVIKHFVSGGADEHPPPPPPKRLLLSKSVMVAKGFQYVTKVHAFQRVECGEVVAKDEQGDIRCPFAGGAYVVMPTASPVKGEEAWIWGEDASTGQQVLPADRCAEEQQRDQQCSNSH